MLRWALPAVFGAIVFSAFPRSTSAESAPATTAEARRALGAVLVNVIEFPPEEAAAPIARVLLAKGADPTLRSGEKGRAALHALAKGTLEFWRNQRMDDWQETAALLLAAGADVNQKSEGPSAARETPLLDLIISAQSADADPEFWKTRREPEKDAGRAAEFLFRHGADPSVRDADGKTALDRAVDLKDSPLKTTLLAVLRNPPPAAGKDAAPATRPALPIDAKSVTLAMNEAASNVIDFPPDDAAVLIECLLEAGADPRDEASKGDVPMHALAFNSGNTWSVSNNDCPRAAAALVKAGAKVNGQGFDGQTPLDDVLDAVAITAPYGRPICQTSLAMIQFLLDHGADPSIRNAKGKTALDLAAEIKDEKASQQLLDLLKGKGKTK